MVGYSGTKPRDYVVAYLNPEGEIHSVWVRAFFGDFLCNILAAMKNSDDSGAIVEILAIRAGNKTKKSGAWHSLEKKIKKIPTPEIIPEFRRIKKD